MSKLAGILPWLPLAAACRYLSDVVGEEVFPALVLNFALAGKLRLSLLLTETWAVRVERVSPEIAERVRETSGLKPYFSLRGFEFDGIVIERRGAPCILSGIYDLPLIASGRARIEKLFLELQGSVAPRSIPTETYVVDQDGQLFEIVQHRPEGKLDYAFLDEFPTNSQLVLRDHVLADIASDLRQPHQRPLGQREKDTLLKIIAGLAVHHYGFDPRAGQNVAPKAIHRDLATRGIDVSIDTIRDKLHEGGQFLPPAKEKAEFPSHKRNSAKSRSN